MNLMPGIGFFEMVLLVVVAIVVIGPKDLPLMMRKFGRFTGKMRAMAFEFKQGIDELGRQAELEELRKEVADLKKHTGMEEFQREFEKDRINLEMDVNSALAPAAALPAAQAASAAPAEPVAANGAAPTPPIPSHAGLSAEHPGYDTGEDFRIEGHGPLTEPAPATAAEPVPPASPTSEPVKQDSVA
jgi:sec-independent protein translocase protein TatB